MMEAPKVWAVLSMPRPIIPAPRLCDIGLRAVDDEDNLYLRWSSSWLRPDMTAKSAEVSLHLHMTEDGAKVGSALKETLGVEVTTSEVLYGHNGNLILDERAALTEPQAEVLLRKVLGGLSPSDRASLLGEIPMHLDEKGTFFLRLDKQEVVRGNIVMAESDAVKIRVRLDCRGEEAAEEIRACLI
jgi:RNA binding exosome subunit